MSRFELSLEKPEFEKDWSSQPSQPDLFFLFGIQLDSKSKYQLNRLDRGILNSSTTGLQVNLGAFDNNYVWVVAINQSTLQINSKAFHNSMTDASIIISKASKPGLFKNLINNLTQNIANQTEDNVQSSLERLRANQGIVRVHCAMLENVISPVVLREYSDSNHQINIRLVGNNLQLENLTNFKVLNLKQKTISWYLVLHMLQEMPYLRVFDNTSEWEIAQLLMLMAINPDGSFFSLPIRIPKYMLKGRFESFNLPADKHVIVTYLPASQMLQFEASSNDSDSPDRKDSTSTFRIRITDPKFRDICGLIIYLHDPSGQPFNVNESDEVSSQIFKLNQINRLKVLMSCLSLSHLANQSTSDSGEFSNIIPKNLLFNRPHYTGFSKVSLVGDLPNLTLYIGKEGATLDPEGRMEGTEAYKGDFQTIPVINREFFPYIENINLYWKDLLDSITAADKIYLEKLQTELRTHRTLWLPITPLVRSQLNLLNQDQQTKLEDCTHLYFGFDSEENWRIGKYFFENSSKQELEQNTILISNQGINGFPRRFFEQAIETCRNKDNIIQSIQAVYVIKMGECLNDLDGVLDELNYMLADLNMIGAFPDFDKFNLGIQGLKKQYTQLKSNDAPIQFPKDSNFKRLVNALVKGHLRQPARILYYALARQIELQNNQAEQLRSENAVVQRQQDEISSAIEYVNSFTNSELNPTALDDVLKILLKYPDFVLNNNDFDFILKAFYRSHSVLIEAKLKMMEEELRLIKKMKPSQ